MSGGGAKSWMILYTKHKFAYFIRSFQLKILFILKIEQ